MTSKSKQELLVLINMYDFCLFINNITKKNEILNIISVKCTHEWHARNYNFLRQLLWKQNALRGAIHLE